MSTVLGQGEMEAKDMIPWSHANILLLILVLIEHNVYINKNILLHDMRCVRVAIVANSIA